MIIEHDLDCPALYRTVRHDLIALARSLTPEQCSTPVPATPEWSVHDAIAHVVGITSDLNAQDFGADGGGDAWTAAQVARRRSASIDDLAAEWDREGPTFEEGLALFGYELGSHYLGDLLQHVADVHHALDRTWRPDADALIAALDFYLDSFHTTLQTNNLGAVRVTAGDEQVLLGAGDEVAAVRADPAELFRCLGGRRSLDQIAALAWSGRPDAVTPFVSRYPVPTRDLIERIEPRGHTSR